MKLVSAVLVALLISGCSTPKPRTISVPVPKADCTMPPLPAPRGPVELRLVDDKDPKSDVIMTQEGLKTVVLFIEELKGYAVLALKCPNVKVEQTPPWMGNDKPPEETEE